MNTTTQRDSLGGCPAVKGRTTGFFHTERITDRWYLVDPEGYAFLMVGMSSLGRYPEQRTRRETSDPARKEQLRAYRENAVRRYPTARDWYAENTARLRAWGFNAIMSEPRDPEHPSDMPYCILFACCPSGNPAPFVDVYSEQFEATVAQRVKERCAPHRDDPNLIGYFSDNEISWLVTWEDRLLDTYLSLPSGSAGCAAALAYVRDRFSGRIEQFNSVWDARYATWADLAESGAVEPGPGFDRVGVAGCRDGFVYLAARRYFETVRREIRRVDPNHLILGVRFLTGDFSLAIAKAMRGCVDVVSTNAYLVRYFPDEFFAALCAEADAPLVLSEFGYRGADAGIPVGGPGAIPRIVATQNDRAKKYRWYVTEAFSRPYLVGVIWWWYQDGWGGWNTGNYGFVNWDFEPYETLVKSATDVNLTVYSRSAADRTPPDNPPVPEYRIRPVEPMVLDGDWGKYPAPDIRIDHRGGYEGYEFEATDLSAEAVLLHDRARVYLAVKVRTTYRQEPAAEHHRRRPPSPWARPGVEFYFGHHQGLLYFDEGRPAVVLVRKDPFDGIEVGGVLLDGGYVIEAAVPKRLLADVVTGNRLRFAVGVNEGDGYTRHRQIYYPLSYEWRYLESFACGILG